MDKTLVVIVGAGPAGLALAAELGGRGVRCVVVERNDRVGYAARAKTVNVRTRTHMRRWGIADRLAAIAPFGVDYPSNVIFVTRLNGPELARFENAFNAAPQRDSRYPEHAQWVPQYKLEEVMRAHVAGLASVEIRFNTELVDATQAGDTVTARLRDLTNGREYEMEAAYMVGADGSRSRAREAIGAKMHGRSGLSHNYNIVFRAPGLAAAHRHGPGIMYWQVNPEAPSLIGPMDTGDRWFFMPTGIAPGTQLSDAEATALIACSTGIDLPYEIISRDYWVAHRLIADCYSRERMFMIGDACHLHPPFGGYGMNMGVADGVDLGWKMAAVLNGWGGPALLASYETERRPIHDWVMDEAEANHALLGNQLWVEGLEGDDAAGERLREAAGARVLATKVREFRTLGAVLGYCYDGSPVIAGEMAVPRDARHYTPSSRPGCVAPHAWLADGSSLYDAFRQGFALLAGAAAEDGDLAAARAQAERRSVPLTIVRLGAEIDPELYPAALTLVRPDQHVAWRGEQWTTAILDLVTGAHAEPKPAGREYAVEHG